MKRIVVLAWVLALAFAIVPATAVAEEKPVGPAPTPMGADEAAVKVNEIEATVKEHLKEKSLDALRLDLAAIVKQYAVTEDPKLRARLTALVGQILQTTKNDDLE